MGANVFSRPQTERDVARIFSQVKGSPLELSPTVTDTLEFPDTEEVTGSNPVRPTAFFESCLAVRAPMRASHLRIYPLPAGDHDVPDAVLARHLPGNVGQTPGSRGRRR